MSLFNKETADENDSFGDKVDKFRENVKETLSSDRDVNDKTSGVVEDAKDAFAGPRSEGLGEHKEGEDAGQWIRNDLEQTKEDLNVGHRT